MYNSAGLQHISEWPVTIEASGQAKEAAGHETDRRAQAQRRAEPESLRILMATTKSTICQTMQGEWKMARALAKQGTTMPAQEEKQLGTGTACFSRTLLRRRSLNLGAENKGLSIYSFTLYR